MQSRRKQSPRCAPLDGSLNICVADKRFQTTEQSLQQRQEAADDVVHKLRQLMKRWEKRLTFDNIQFSRRFLASEIQILVHFGVCDPLDNSVKEWIACFEPITAIETCSGKQAIVPDGDEGSVFVDVVKLIQSPERVIPTLVRLERINGFHCFRKHSLYFSSLHGFVYLESLCDRERNIPVGFYVGGPVLSKPNLSEVPSQMVQGTSEILNDVSGRRDDVERQNRERREAQAALAGIRIIMGANDMHILAPNISALGLKLRQVLFGPFNFYPDEYKAVLRG